MRKKVFDIEGYLVLKKIFTKEELLECQVEINNYIKNNNTFKSSGGISIPDFIKIKDLSKNSKLKDKKKIHEMLKVIFSGDNYRFCSHNDIGINRVVGWHKDKLNGVVSKYETVNIWKEHDREKHEIVKVLIYLENHGNNNDGLKLWGRVYLKCIEYFNKKFIVYYDSINYLIYFFIILLLEYYKKINVF